MANIPTLNTNPIVGADGRPLTNFQGWLNSAFSKIETSVTDLATQLGLIATAQSTANTAQTAADTAQAAADAAQTAADDAAADAATAQANAALALDALDNLGDDGKLSPVEKKIAMREYEVLLEEQSDIDAKATAYGVTTEKTNYDSALAALTTYLDGLTSPVNWDDITDYTTIVGVTWNTWWADVYRHRQFLLNKVAEIAGTKATWAGVTGSGKPADNATVGANLATNVTGRLSTGAVSIPVNWNVGIKALNSGFALSDSVVDASNCQINIAASTYRLDNGDEISYPSGTLSSRNYATTYYVYRTDASLNGGGSYGSTTAIENALNTGRVYLGYLTTRASSGSGTGGTGGGGGSGGCPDINALVLTDRGLLKAKDVRKGDKVRTLTLSMNDTEWEPVTSNHVESNDCVRITTASASLTLSMNTPIVDAKGEWTIAANAHLCHLPVLVDGKVRWEKCTSVEYIGRMPVSKLRCSNGIFAAGDTGDALILTHNPYTNKV